MTPLERYAVLHQLKRGGADIEHVPIIEPCFELAKKLSTIDELLEFAEGTSLHPQTKREGLVFKSHWSDFTFKAIANSYLLKHKDR